MPDNVPVADYWVAGAQLAKSDFVRLRNPFQRRNSVRNLGAGRCPFRIQNDSDVVARVDAYERIPQIKILASAQVARKKRRRF